MKCLKCQKPFATGSDQLCFDCKYPDPHEYWAVRCGQIAEIMKNTGVGELIIRRKKDGKYTFEVTPEPASLEHDVIFDNAFGHPGVDTCKNCDSNSMRKDWRNPCKGKSDSWIIGPCPHCGHDGFSRPYGMDPAIYECNKCKGTWHRGWKP